MAGLKSLTDPELLNFIRKGEQKALVTLFNRNNGIIKSYIQRNNGNHADAEDMLQEALVIFWQNVQDMNFTLTSKIDTYIFAIVKHLWYKQLRKHGKTHLSTFEEDFKAPIHYDDEDVLDEKVKLLSRFMNELNETCRKILSLFYYEEWDMERIAFELNFNNADTAKAKKWQCKKKLEDLVKKEYERKDLF